MTIEGVEFWCAGRAGSILESEARVAFSLARRTLVSAASTMALLVLGPASV
jgi:hypothetical protein